MQISPKTLAILAAMGDKHALEAYELLDSWSLVFYHGAKRNRLQNGFYLLSTEKNRA